MMLTLDGTLVEARGSLLDTALAAGLDLPHLCKDDNLPAVGACRTCLVEADGRIVAACATPAASASEVSTTSDRVVRVRRGVLELTAAMMADREASVTGPHGGDAFHTVASQAADSARYLLRRRTYVDASNPFFAFYEESCILCGRCTTACQELQHIGAIGLAGRGLGTRVTPGPGGAFIDSICTSCGSCVAACPTAALRPKSGGW